MKKCGIYKITCIVNGKIIIGLSKNIEARWSRYLSELKHGRQKNRYLQNAWNKYGECNFKFEVILECPPEKLAEEEKRLIKENNSNDRRYGYNITEGGEHPTVTEETRTKISLALTGKPKSESHKQKDRLAHLGKFHSDKTKQKISLSLVGKRSGANNSNYGKHPSEETLLKLRNSHLGKTLPESQKIKISNALTGIKRSQETIEKCRKANIGKKMSLEAKEKMSQAKKGKILSSEHRMKLSIAMTKFRAYQRQARGL